MCSSQFNHPHNQQPQDESSPGSLGRRTSRHSRSSRSSGSHRNNRGGWQGQGRPRLISWCVDPRSRGSIGDLRETKMALWSRAGLWYMVASCKSFRPSDHNGWSRLFGGGGPALLPNVVAQGGLPASRFALFWAWTRRVVYKVQNSRWGPWERSNHKAQPWNPCNHQKTTNNHKIRSVSISNTGNTPLHMCCAAHLTYIAYEQSWTRTRDCLGCQKSDPKCSLDWNAFSPTFEKRVWCVFVWSHAWYNKQAFWSVKKSWDMIGTARRKACIVLFWSSRWAGSSGRHW